MKWLIHGLSIALIISACLLVPEVTAGGNGGHIPPIPPDDDSSLELNFFDREPVLFFETAGYTLTGAYHRRLSVYSDGSASASMVSGIPRHLMKDAAFTTVPLSAVQMLQGDLVRAEANRLTDQQWVVKDVPMSTVTFFEASGPRSMANSFNYFLPHDDWASVDAVIDRFFDMWFPGF